jgi:transketolase
MIGVAAGMAIEGKRPIVYTIVPFAVMRPFEQIRVDVCMQNLPVTIVGVGGGLSYGPLGPTHHAIEDIAIMRALPNMTVWVPSGPRDARLATRSVLSYDKPAYIRLGKNGEPDLDFVDDIRSQVTIMGCGPILSVALDAAELLRMRRISCRVVNIRRVKPLEPEYIRGYVRTTDDLIVTLEEHSIIGGMGSAVSESVAGMRRPIPVHRCGIRDHFVTQVGSRDYLLKELCLTAQDIAQEIEGPV